MTKRPDQFALTLDADLREKLEAHRVRLGLRSQAEALRVLIRGETVIETPFVGFTKTDRLIAVEPDTLSRQRRKALDAMPIAKFKPHPKPGKR